MARRSMDDLIIILPGIMGSVLTKHGQDLWAPSLDAVARLRQRETLLRDLLLDGDDPDREMLDDGVMATRLMPDVQLIPGFWKIDGYTSLITAIIEQFEVTQGDIYNPNPDANLFPFPYDWRRDNRSSAKRLQAFIERQLPIWRERSGNTTANVILICHSMGGLIARYYLEVLGGREHCKALFTLGTPHRGSLNALDYLSNGYTLFKSLDVSEALRSYTSTYQLLPTYQVIEHENTYVDLLEIETIYGLSRMRVEQARHQFHDPIAAEARSRLGDPGYYSGVIIGTQQLTKQSARLNRTRVEIGTALPDPVRDLNLGDFGDGTVPFYAALPPGVRQDDLKAFYTTTFHGSLQSNISTQQQLLTELGMRQSQVPDGILGVSPEDADARPALRLLLDDAYPPEGGVIRVRPVNIPDPGSLIVTLTPLDGTHQAQRRTIVPHDDEWPIELDHPTPGIYRIGVELYSFRFDPVEPVRDLFEVVGE